MFPVVETATPSKPLNSPSPDPQPPKPFKNEHKIVSIAKSLPRTYFQERTVRIEDLNSVISRVADNDVALIVDGHAARELELPIFRTFRAESRQRSAIHIEDLNAMIVAVAHDDAVRVADGDVVRMF